MAERTCMAYYYRDAGGNMKPNVVYLDGILTEAEKQEIFTYRNCDGEFIPSQVGLPETRFDDEDDDLDHCWFQLCEDAFEEVQADPEQWPEMDVAQLLVNFREVNGHWNDGLR